MNKIDTTWNKIFEEKNVLSRLQSNRDLFQISANEIKNYKVEPRLMTKFDHRSNLPQVFQKNDLGILPTTRGNYVIGRFDAYSDFSKKPYELKNITKVKFPNWIETININDLHSEPQIISIAAISGMISKLLGKNSINLFSTVSGRMSTGRISFVINGIPINVENSQMEIDAGFEDRDLLVIIEAKMHQADTFLVRQLYYPYRVWSKRVNKKVVPVYLQYDNGIFNFSVFDFDDLNDYSSIKLVDRKNFTLDGKSIEIADLLAVYNQTKSKVVSEPNYKKCPFPQANSLDKLLEILNYLLTYKQVTKDQLSVKLDIVARQVDYYANAGKYLGIINVSNKLVTLTENGLNFCNKTNVEKLLLLSDLILKHQIFREVFAKMIKSSDKTIADKDVITIMKKEPSITNAYNDGVISRRASTVKKWIEYLINSCVE